MIPLEQISVPSPCPARWDAMEGGVQTRFCTGCRKNVYNLSEMSRREGEDLLTRTDARVCVFFFPSADGSPMPREEVPADFPLASRLRPGVWRRVWAAALSGLAAVALSVLGGSAQAVTPVPHGKSAGAHHARPGIRQRLGRIAVRHAPPKIPPLGGKPAAPPPSVPHPSLPQPLGGVPVIPALPPQSLR